MLFGQQDPLAQLVAELSAVRSSDQPYSVPLPDTQVAGRTHIYRHWWSADKELLTTLDPALRTPHDGFEAAATKFPKNKCLGHRPYDPTTKSFGPYEWEDYETVQRRRKNLGAGLVRLHKQAGVMEESYGIGVWCQNRPEWQLVDLAAMSQRLYTVSLYDTLGPDTTEYIINHAQLQCVATGLNHVVALLKLKPRLPTLKLIIVMDPLSAGEQPGESKGDLLNAMASDVGVSLHYIRDVEALGEQHPIPYHPPTPDDRITINYTSGTTGQPKGVVLTHRNAQAAQSTGLTAMCGVKHHVYCSFLPLAHIFERNIHGVLFTSASAIGFFHGNVAELVDDLKLLRPTAFIAVPRLYNRFGGAIKAATIEQSGVKGALSRHIVSTKLAALNDPRNPTQKHALYDRLWARKVAAALGLDRCKVMISGAAPIDPGLCQFLRIIFSNHFFQGYGLTETYASSLLQLPGDFSTSCGALTHGVEACLADVPDMDYLSTDTPQPRGELLLRGTTVFQGYLGDAEETAKAIDADGWFHTGDIATIDARGRIAIIDRKKNVLKLAHGEYVSPERIENAYLAQCGWMATAYVHGDSAQSSLVGLFGVAPDTFPAFANKVLGLGGEGAGQPIAVNDVQAIEGVLRDGRIERAALKELERVARKNRFNGYEKVQALRLYVEPFTVANGLLTPTLKLKRPPTVKMYRAHIDELYAQVLSGGSGKGKAKL